MFYGLFHLFILLTFYLYSFRYFRALAKGETPPVKERKNKKCLKKERQIHFELGLEMPLATQKTDTGLTMGLLKILHKQVGI